MFELLLTSSLVSLVTLGILLFRRRRPQSLAIPTFAYGAAESSAASELRLSRPPIFLWLLVLLITLCFAIAYYRDDSESLTGQNSLTTYVWVDRSLSSWLAFHDPDKGADPEQLARDVMRSSGRVTFIRSDTRWNNEEGRWKVEYATEDASSVAAAQAIIESIYEHGNENGSGAGASPFASDLDVDGFRDLIFRSLQSEGGGADIRKGRLVVLTDAQRSSMSALTAVSQLFSEIRLVALPPTLPQALRASELIPRSLAEAWSNTDSTALPDGDPGQTFLSLAPAGASEPAWAQTIPEDARPGIFLSEFPGGETFVTSAESGLIVRRASEALAAPALFTHCSRYPGGPAELNPLADLQAFARFFNVKLRTVDCNERTSNTRQVNTADPWRFRRASLWLVPLSRAITNTLLFQNAVWLPEDFIPDQDSLFFFADPTEGADAMSDSAGPEGSQPMALRRQVVQLEDNAVPLPLYLSPPPPSKNMSLSTGSLASGDDSVLGSFSPVYKTPDGTALIYQFVTVGGVDRPTRQTPGANEAAVLGSQTARAVEVYFLRTTLAMPNGELGRSSLWANFWLQALARAGSRRAGITMVRYAGPAALQLDPFPAPQGLNTLGSTPALGLWKKMTDGASAGGPRLRPGLYESAETGQMYLVEFPLTESDGQFLTESELQEAFSAAEPEAGEPSKDAPGQVHWHTILALLAGLMALGVYWFRLNQKSTPASLSGSALLLVLAMSPQAMTSRAGIGWPEISAWSLIEQQANAASALSSAPSSGQTTLVQAGPSQLTDRLFQSLTGNVAPFLGGQEQKLPEDILVPFRISWCNETDRAVVTEGYNQYRNMLASRGTIHLDKNILFGKCFPGGAEIWWTDDLDDLDPTFLKTHIRSGGVFVLEGVPAESSAVPEDLQVLEEPSVGLRWETPEKRGMLYRSFYLLQTFDGCVQDNTKLLTLRKKETAKSPMGLITSASFLRKKTDCFAQDQDYRSRSFVNLMYSLLTTDYKEDQLQLPELLKRVRNLGLEP